MAIKNNPKNASPKTTNPSGTGGFAPRPGCGGRPGLGAAVPRIGCRPGTRGGGGNGPVVMALPPAIRHRNGRTARPGDVCIIRAFGDRTRQSDVRSTARFLRSDRLRSRVTDPSVRHGPVWATVIVVRIIWEHRRLGALRLSILSTVLVFVIIPTGIITLVAALALSGGDKSHRAPRYRPGRQYDFRPIWFLAAPEQVSAVSATTGHATTGHATTGHATTGHATTGHATTGHATTGHATTGHATTGHATTGHATTGHATPALEATGSVAAVDTQVRPGPTGGASDSW